MTEWRLTDDEILSHVDAILAAARDFQKIAGELMEKLAQKHQVSVEQIGSAFYRFDLDESNSFGDLDGTWRYQFHGFECAFYNADTETVVDVLLGFGTEFGVLDPWFFQRFVASSPEHVTLAAVLSDFDTAAQVIDTLVANGLLWLHTGEFIAEGLRRQGYAACRAESVQEGGTT